MDLLTNFKKYLLKNKKSHGKATVKNYLADVKKFVSWFESTFHKEFAPSEVNKELAEIYRLDLSTGKLNQYPLSARSIKRYMSSLKKFYDFLIETNVARDNPFFTEQILTDQPADKFYLKEFENFLILTHTSQATIKNYLADINQFTDWVEKIPDHDSVKDITTLLIEEYKDRLLYEAKFAPVSVNRKLSSIRKYLSWAKNQNYMPNNIEFDQLQVVSNGIKIEQNPAIILPQPTPDIKEEIITYSGFPPLRMVQKLLRLSNATFDLLVLFPVVKSVVAVKYQWWKLTGKKVFTTGLDGMITGQQSITGVRSLPKDFYAPLKVSTAGMPFHIKVYHLLRHSRPSWYRKYHSRPFIHYVHFGILLIYVTFLGLTIYHAFMKDRIQPSVLGTANSHSRVLSFKGRLTDTANMPITEESHLRFGLYNDRTASGSALIWQETQIVKPDADGNFETNLGQHQAISEEFFDKNPYLFLGISIANNPELYPRQQVATVFYSKDSERLQGMLPSSDSNAGGANIILALDSSGNLTIGGNSSPKFEVTGGEFTLSGQTLTLKTGDGSNSNVQIIPDGAGIIDLQKPIQNTTNYSMAPGMEGMVNFNDSIGIMAESSTQSALLINQNSTGNLISANSNGTAKFAVDYIGSAMIAQNLAVNGNNLTTTSSVFSLVDKNVFNLNIGGEASAISIGATTGLTFINNGFRVASSSAFQGSITANGGINIPDGSLGIGTTTPLYALDLQDQATTSAVAQIYNTSTDAEADGLIIKVGNSLPSLTNNFIGFANGSGSLIGKITGNLAGTNVIYNTSGADYAEYYKKADPNEAFEQGEIVCIGRENGVTKCKDNSRILGVVSNTAGFVGAGNHDNDSDFVLVGIVGQLPVKIASESGKISSGDALTLGSNGLVKAEKPGMIIGRALQSFDPQISEARMVKIALNVGWYHPGVELNEAGKLNIDEPVTEFESYIEQQIGDIIENIKLGMIEAEKISTQSFEIASENITIGGQTLAEYIRSVVVETVLAQELIANNFNFQSSIISPIAQIDRIHTDIVSPLSSDPNIALKFEDSKISVINPNASSSAVASIDNEGNASFSGTLRARRIIADEIDLSNEALAKLEGFNIPTATIAANNITNITNIYNSISTISGSTDQSASSSADIATLSDPPVKTTLTAEFARFNQGLVALGGSSLTDVSINGALHLGQSLVLSENTVNTIGTTLELQPLRQGDVSVMGGLVKIDTQGNLNVNGNGVFAKDLEVRGSLSANVISPIPGKDLVVKLTTDDGAKPNSSAFKINDSKNKEVFRVNQLGDIIASGSAQVKSLTAGSLNIIRGAQADTSLTETIASGSAGTAVIAAYKTERTIKTPYVKEDSLIYITTTSDTFGMTPYIARQTVEGKNTKGSFTVQIPESATRDIKLNWWIVN